MYYDHTRSAWPPHSYNNIYITQERYKSALMSIKIVDQTRSIPTLLHKPCFPYECSCWETMAVRWGATMWPVVGRGTRLNFGNIWDYYEKKRVLLEQRETLSAMFFHSVPPCPAPGGCSATTIVPLAPPHRARPRGAGLTSWMSHIPPNLVVTPQASHHTLDLRSIYRCDTRSQG